MIDKVSNRLKDKIIQYIIRYRRKKMEFSLVDFLFVIHDMDHLNKSLKLKFNITCDFSDHEEEIKVPEIKVEIKVQEIKVVIKNEIIKKEEVKPEVKKKKLNQKLNQKLKKKKLNQKLKKKKLNHKLKKELKHQQKDKENEERD